MKAHIQIYTRDQFPKDEDYTTYLQTLILTTKLITSVGGKIVIECYGVDKEEEA